MLRFLRKIIALALIVAGFGMFLFTDVFKASNDVVNVFISTLKGEDLLFGLEMDLIGQVLQRSLPLLALGLVGIVAVIVGFFSPKENSFGVVISKIGAALIIVLVAFLFTYSLDLACLNAGNDKIPETFVSLRSMFEITTKGYISLGMCAVGGLLIV